MATSCVQGEVLAGSWTAEDTVSGIANVVATLVDETFDPRQDALETWTLSPGPHTLALTATDAAGWSAHASRVFTVTVTLDSLVALAQQLYDTGEIDGHDAGEVVARIGAQLDQAEAALNTSNVAECAQQLETLIADVGALTEKQITPAGAARLIEALKYLMSEVQAR